MKEQQCSHLRVSHEMNDDPAPRAYSLHGDTTIHEMKCLLQPLALQGSAEFGLGGLSWHRASKL